MVCVCVFTTNRLSMSNPGHLDFSILYDNVSYIYKYRCAYMLTHEVHGNPVSAPQRHTTLSSEIIHGK